MTNTFLTRSTLAVIVVLAAACGGSDGADDDTGEAPDPDVASTAAAEPSGDAGAAAGTTGTVVVVVDGTTIEGTADTCNVSSEALALAATGSLDGDDVTISAQGSGADDAWVIQMSVVDAGGATRYLSTNSSTAAVSGSSVEITGEWVWDDAEGTMQSGEGTLTATCS